MKNGIRAFYSFKIGIDYAKFIYKVPEQFIKNAQTEKKYVLIVQLVAHRHVVLRHHSKIAGAISSYLSLNQPTLWRIRWNRNSSSWIYFFFHLRCNRFQAANPQYRFNAETIGWQRRKAGFLSVSSAGNTGHSGPQRTE